MQQFRRIDSKCQSLAEKKKALLPKKQGFLFLARPERFERPTLWFVAKYSIQLSYGRQSLLLCNKNSIITLF